MVPDSHETLDQLQQAQHEAEQPVTRADVAEILSQVLGSLDGDVSALDLQIYQELEGLVRYIQAARQEIAAIRPEDLSSEYIMSATDELDAVVGATEKATGEILDAAEAIQSIADGLDEAIQTRLVDQVTRIFEASNFQDLTGQRITKVVRVLKHIEERVGDLVAALGAEVERVRQSAGDAVAEDDKQPSEADLLNGPQLPGGGNDQDEIDRLLASFD